MTAYLIRVGANKRSITSFASAFLLAALLPCASKANSMLDDWAFQDTNWLSYHGSAPLAFTNIVNVSGAGDGGALLLDTSNTIPAFLLYKTTQTNGAPSINCSNGTIAFWFNPDWSSVDETGGSGPGDWANLIVLGDTNGSNFWGLYLDPGGTNISFSASAPDGSLTTYLSAPVSLTSNTWSYFVLSYDPATNSTLYFDGQPLTNGAPITIWPATNVTFFAVGSGTNGFSQARGMFDRLVTYDYELQSNVVLATYEVISSIFYGGPENDAIGSAPSAPTNTPTFNAVTGSGYLQMLTNVSPCATSSNVWITNAIATVTSNGTVNLIFTIAGGTNVLYDVFANASLNKSDTNYQWAWMGQGPSCKTYLLTNLPNQSAYLILGTPLDSDSDGLTDAYELLVSHTDPHVPDTSGDGMLDGWKVLWGLNPLINNVAQSTERSNFNYDPVGWLEILSGTRAESISLDPEGNVKTSQ